MTDGAALLRPARIEEAGDIARLLLTYAMKDLLLPRSEQEIQDQIDHFLVADLAARVVGCVSLRDYGNGLWEVRSLAVRQEAEGHGLGTELVQAAVALARARQAERIFALTLRPHLFTRLGFAVVEKELFPEKVWTDCERCTKREFCDETAVLLDV